MPKNKKLKVVLCAGGSGGHIFPAETLAVELEKKGVKVYAFTDKRGHAFKTKSKNVFKIQGEAVTGKKIINKISALSKLGIGTIQAYLILQRIKPNAVIGFGGFASVPGIMAARLACIPVILHEQNAVLGRANRLAGKFAKLLLTSFKETKLVPEGLKTAYVGMPIRPEIAEKIGTPYPILDDKSSINILVIGGSQGATILSKVVPEALKLLPLDIKKRINLSQQCRSEDLEEVKKAYAESGIKTNLASFFKDIPEKMANAHLVICRSGSSSMAELFAIGRPAILVPYKLAADNHQKANALSLTSCGGGWLMPEDSFSITSLNERLTELLKNPDTLKRASKCALNKDVAKVAEKLALAVIDTINQK